MRLPRTPLVATIIAAGFILPSFVLGLLVAIQPATHAKTQPRISLSSTMSKTQTEPSATTSTTTSTTTPASINLITQPSETNTPHTSTLAIPATPATPPAPQKNSTPIIALSAVLSDWTQPQPTDSKFGLGCRDTSRCPGGYTAYPTFVQYRYCIWTYSDNSTQQKLYEDWYWSPNTSMQIIPEPLIDCTITNAPAAQ